MAGNKKGIELAEVIPDKCIGCQLCAGICPVGAIEIIDGVARIDPDACIGCGKCADVCPVESIKFERKRPRAVRKKKAETPAGVPGYEGVAVFVEVLEGRGASVSWELVGKARDLAGKLGTTVLGFVVGREVEEVARQALAYGCDDVHVVDDPLLETYLPRSYGKAVSDLCATVKPEILLMGATLAGRDLSGVVATILETGLTADCTGLDIDEEKRILLMTRPTFGGNIMATIFCERHRPQMSTVRPKVFKFPEKDAERKGSIPSSVRAAGGRAPVRRRACQGRCRRGSRRHHPVPRPHRCGKRGMRRGIDAHVPAARRPPWRDDRLLQARRRVGPAAL